ncbi:hypothetical protein CTI12_AA135500 [Artemisia annua]|uniref:KIB1-4 beta-propeller domain-containing protein n=1 Tax=Artemisia annua TaxID=35608 RepID=A0A2U1PN06_ARTAN|nr:hypothetical protein CTI12_AA135500 [Artemisia annua]
MSNVPCYHLLRYNNTAPLDIDLVLKVEMRIRCMTDISLNPSGILWFFATPLHQMEKKQISSSSICDGLPPLSSRYQWFVAQNLEAGDQIIFTMEKPMSHYRCRIPVLTGRRIRGCFHGWMILSSHPNIVMWSLWNPLTSKLISLPPLIHKDADSLACCLSSPPDDPNSVFLFTSSKNATVVFCRLDRKRKKLKWTEMSFAKQLKSMSGEVSGEDIFLESPTCCNGKVYAIAVARDYRFVIQFDIVVKDKEVVIKLCSFVDVRVPSFNKCPPLYTCPIHCSFLKGNNAELFFIIIGFIDKAGKTVDEVFLYKLDMKSMKWEAMEDLKDGVFFMDLASDDDTVFYSRPVSSELRGYVHILGEMGKVVYSYQVKDRTISISSVPCVIQDSQVSAWAMLECGLEDNHDSKQEEDKENQIVVRSGKGDDIGFYSMTYESQLLNIPFHMLESIMESIVGVEYMRFRATCKHCHLAAPSIKWSSKTTIKRLETYSLMSPWLMVLDQYQGLITFIDPICGDKYYVNTPRELMGDYQIYSSKYGWLLMYKVCTSLIFFNPFTSDIRELPPVPYLASFCFSAPPTSPDCMVVGFTKGDWNVYIHFVAREQSWHRISLDFEGHDPYVFRFSTFYDRDLYALFDDGGIDVLRITSEEDFCWDHVLAKSPKSCCRTPTQYFLASCDQHLLLVIVGEFGESVEVGITPLMV